MILPHDTQAPVWLFDSRCLLCSRAVRFTLRHERVPRIRFVAIRSAEGRSLATRYGLDPDDPETFLFLDNGQALAKSDGVLALVSHLSGPARLLGLARLIPRACRDLVYDLVARNRYALFGQSETCQVPASRHRHRFVLPEGRG